MAEAALDPKVLCLFDVDGTLTAARQVVRSSEPEEDPGPFSGTAFYYQTLKLQMGQTWFIALIIHTN